jgi:succinate dehydrogenase flavin-adding protein (antitoxin of CptAB toxin-antitoxin module)
MDLLPSTKDKRKRCMLQCQSDQREERLLWRSMRGFVEFSKEFRHLEIEKEFDACFDLIGI